jgi:glycosyltransferase involved in cell wall biosynthesis
MTMDPALLSVFDIDPFRVGSVESFARELSSQLGERGWESILCFANSPPEPVRRYLDLPNVSIEVVKGLSGMSWQTIRSLASSLGHYRPRILHLHFTPLLGPYAWLAKLYSVKLVFFTDHASRPSGHLTSQAPAAKRLAARFMNLALTGMVCVSDYGYHCAAGRGLFSATRMRRIYPGVVPSAKGVNGSHAASFRQRYSISESCLLVVQVSWMIPEKGISDLLQAARRVVAQHSGVHFALVGDGAYKEQFVGQTGELGLAEHVTWTGRLTNPLAEEGVYAAADVICQVSRWEEVFGATIAEAMSCGKPVVATTVGGIPELVKNGETGFLVPPGDVVAIADKILVLLGDRDLRERMGAAGRKVAEAKFDIKKNVAELLRLYGIA